MFAPYGLFASFRLARARRSAARTLRSLSFAQLRDIGIPSDAVDDVAAEMVALAAMRAAAVPVGPQPGLRYAAPALAALRAR